MESIKTSGVDTMSRCQFDTQELLTDREITYASLKPVQEFVILSDNRKGEIW